MLLFISSILKEITFGTVDMRKLMITLMAIMCLTAVQSKSDDDDIVQLKEIFNSTSWDEAANSTFEDLILLTVGRKRRESPEKDKADCLCVPYYLCKDGVINDDGTDILDIRFGVSECLVSMDVCCKTKPQAEARTLAPIQTDGCGYRNENGIGFRIIGDLDNEAQYGEFPWMIAVLKIKDSEENNTEEYLCGGSLINPKFVLTAAHCVVRRKAKSLIARGGEWDTQTTHEMFAHEDRKILKVIIHENFYSGGLHNDIALLELEKPFTLTRHLNIVCLPKQEEVVLNNNCYVAGWGKDNFGKEGKYQVILKRAEIPMVPRESCQDDLRKTMLGQKFKLHKSFVCAGGIKGVGACRGDGGSALVCPIEGTDDKQYHQVGIVAWGVGCGTETPGMYVNVAHFIDWIYDHMDKYDIKESTEELIKEEDINKDYHF